MPFGLTSKTTEKLCEYLSAIIPSVSIDTFRDAFKEINRREVERIAKNEAEEEVK